MLKITIASAIVAIGALGLTGCDVKKTQEGNVSVPKYEVEKKASGDVTLPKYDVTTPDVSVGSKSATVNVPNVDVNTEKKTIEVPTVSVKTAKEKEAEKAMGAPAAPAK
jgi:hypothetical protein